MRAAGQEKASRFGNPLFTNIAGGDFSFKAGSPALAMGIEPLDLSTAGITPVIHPAASSHTLENEVRLGNKNGFFYLINPPTGCPVTLQLFSMKGAVVFTALFDGPETRIAHPGLAGGFYIARFQSVDHRTTPIVLQQSSFILTR